MVFDSRDPRDKFPFGAVPVGTEVRFTLRPDGSEGFARCTLLCHAEFADTFSETELPACHGVFSGTYVAPARPDLVWYSFRFTRSDGIGIFCGKNGWCGEGQAQAWQLTVYDDTRPTPDWFGRGITYQIFPDRFCRLSVPDGACFLGHREVHENWSDRPFYRPDAAGEIRNNDYFGGSLLGIISKLDYLKSLSVTTLYLNPIFAADSNHRYNTADYMSIDPMLGTEEEFRLLCREAHKRGMRVMLDGVFNHTGSNSRYFNALGTYDAPGAAQSPDSPYYPWYHFESYPDRYDAWWGIKTLPAVNENNPDYRRFIITGADSVVRHWLRAGADAWRLDVADELPDDFIADIRTAMTEERPDSFLLGEVWEDGSNKIAYSRRRRYLLGSETDGLMNYPFRTAALDWLRGGNAADFRSAMETLRENYPRSAFYSALNILGTHDTPRILTLLGAGHIPDNRDDRAAYRLSASELARGKQRLTLAAMLLYTFPGSPTLYYGDEAGMEGFEDPFNRGTYPWDRPDETLLALYRRLGQLRMARLSLQAGELEYLRAEGGLLVYRRCLDGEETLVALNAGTEEVSLTLPCRHRMVADGVTGQQFLTRGNCLHITLPPISGMILI